MKQILASTLAAVAVAAAFPSIAQTGTGNGAAPGAAAERPRMHREDRAFSKPTERAEARLAYVRTALKITPAQETQWSAYADKMRQIAAQREKAMTEMRAQMQQQRGNRPDINQRMELRQKFHADAIRTLNEVLAVQKPLVDSLSPEQKKVAEVVLDPRGQGGGRGGRGFQHERPRGGEHRHGGMDHAA